MVQRMLIDATHPEETRVVAVNGHRLEEFDYETTTKQQLKGNIYLAKVTRVEPSLQAAFVEYGGNRHGFLAFSEIHPDYYRIPVGDREDLIEEDGGEEDDNGADGAGVEELGGDEGSDEAVEETKRARPRLKRHYKIQEVIKRRQVLLVQVLKEERGTKGAALTTYLSLAGRYCVLMPNTSRGGGVSRKISNPQDRKRLKSVLSELEIPDGMAVILRTAGQERSKAEIRRDFDYIMRMWDEVRSKTLESAAPALIHEEANLIRRSVRDLYSKDIDEVLVAGDEGYRIAKDFMKAMIPSHAKKVKRYADEQGVPLFQRYQVEQQLNQIYDPMVQLKSGGSIVLHQTEALVAIDVNSGRATRERHIEETALKTNLEAADEIARQLRLRDLAGLIVIDFIDMEENRNDHAVERRLKEALRSDRARIQVGRISPFGLLEMSRQRLRPSVLEAMTQPCVTCGGIGYIPSTESAALQVLRAIEEEGLRRRSQEITVQVPPTVALYILNHKRATLGEMEENYGFSVTIETDEEFIPPKFVMSRVAKDVSEGAPPQPVAETTEEGEDNGRSRRRRPRRRKRRDEDGTDTDQQDARSNDSAEDDDDDADADNGDRDQEQKSRADEDDDGEGSRKRRKRGRRGGRRRRSRENGDTAEGAETQDADAAGASQDDRQGGEEEADASPAEAAEAPSDGNQQADGESQRRKPRRRSRGNRRRDSQTGDAVQGEEAVQADDAAQADDAQAERSAEDAAGGGEAEAAQDTPSEAQADSEPAEVTAEAAEPEAEAEQAEAAPPRTKAAARKSAKAGARKTGAKRPKTAAAKKAAARKAAADEAEADTSGDASTDEPARDETPAEVQEPAASNNDNAPEAAQQSEAAAETDDSGEAKPRRRGWWNRITGS